MWVSLSVFVCVPVCTCLSAPVCLYLSVYLSVCVHRHLYQSGLFAPFKTCLTFQDIRQNKDTVSLSVCLSVYLCVYMSVFAPVCQCTCLCSFTPVRALPLGPLQDPPHLPGHHPEHRLCESLSLCLSVCLHTSVCTCLSLHLSVWTYLHTCLSVFTYTCTSMDSASFRSHPTFQDIIQNIDTVSISVCLCLCTCLCTCVDLSVFTHPCTTLPYQHCLYKAHPIFQNIMHDLDCVSLSVCVYTCLSVCVAVCVHPTWSTLLYQRGLYRACLTFQIIIQDNYKLCESLCTCLYTCLCSPHLVYTAVPVWPLPGWLHLPERHTWYRLCETLLSVCVYTCLSVCIPICVHPTWSTPCCTSVESQPIQLGEEASKKTEFEIACCGIDCIGEFLTQFWRRGRIKRDGCQRGRHLYTACPAALSHRPVL